MDVFLCVQENNSLLCTELKAHYKATMFRKVRVHTPTPGTLSL